MANHLVFLRGINVSGKNILKMNLLQNLLHSNGFPSSKTYIQSGNISIPNAIISTEKTKLKIESLLLEHFDIETICIVKTRDEIKALLEEIPFSTENTKELYFTFLENTPSKEALEAILEKDYKQDAFEITNDCIYIRCRNGFGKTKLNTTFFENKLKLKATTRNWNTLTKMMALAQG